MLGLAPKKTAPQIEGLVEVQRSNNLLAEHASVLSSIKSTIGVPDKHWRLLYLPLFESFAEFVQRLPASEAHHHCEEGGHLRHSLEVVEISLRLRRGHVLPPGKEPEDVAEEADVWTYAVATAALLHDIGKPLVDQVVTLFGRDGLPMCVWSPWVGTMTSTHARHYRIEFRRGRDYHLHDAVTPLLAPYIVPKDGLRWLGQHTDALAAWLNALGGSTVGVPVIAEIVKEADQCSVGADLSGGRHQVSTARAKPLADRLIVQLRQLLEDGTLPVNRKGAAAFVDGSTVWLVSKRCLDALRESMKAQGQGGIPSRNDRLMDELQQRGIALATSEDRAIWSCSVEVPDGDETWSQELTLLRIPVDHVWPAAEARPDSNGITVTPVEGASEADKPEKATRREPTLSTDPVDPRVIGGVQNRIEPVIEPPARSEGTDVRTTGGEEVTQPPAVDDEVVVLDDIEDAYDPAEAPEEEEPAAQDEPADLGIEFVAWLVKGLKDGRVAVNTAKARVHVVKEGLLLVSPAVFRSVAGDKWLKAQKRFLKLKMTARTSSGENIFHYDVNGDRGKKTIKGMLIKNPEEKLSVKLPEPNSILSAKKEA